MAEVYWDLEWTLQQQGFDYAYDKRLYDRLRDGQRRPVREHFHAGLDYQDKLARFLENHDEPPRRRRLPAAASTRPRPSSRSSRPACGSSTRASSKADTKRISPHLVRGPKNPSTPCSPPSTNAFLPCCKCPSSVGRWQLIDPSPAWDGNATATAFIAFAWCNDAGEHVVVAVNYSPHQSQCYVRLPFADLAGKQWRLADRLGDAVYDLRRRRTCCKRLVLRHVTVASHSVFADELSGNAAVSRTRQRRTDGDPSNFRRSRRRLTVFVSTDLLTASRHSSECNRPHADTSLPCQMTGCGQSLSAR